MNIATYVCSVLKHLGHVYRIYMRKNLDPLFKMHKVG